MNIKIGVALTAICLGALCAGTAMPAQQAAPSPAELSRLHELASDFGALQRYAAANAALPASQPGRVVFYGDSITDSWAKPPHTFFPGKPYIGRGISGHTTPQMLVRFRQDVIDLHPVAVVILAGTNDIAGNQGVSTLEMIENNLQSMAELGKVAGIKVILASVTPVIDYPWRKGLEPAPKIQALNAWIAQYCASNHLVYLDFYSALADANGGMKPGLSKDGVHPTDQGYAIMEPLAQAAIDKALKP
jgi:lysophospholipase L1-like esterase